MPTIQNFQDKIKVWLEKPPVITVIKALILSLILIASFGLGRLSVLDQKNQKGTQVSIYLPDGSHYTPEASKMAQNEPRIGNTGANALEAIQAQNGQNQTAQVFASKSGKTYYFTWCKSGNRVKEENRVYFDSSEQAEAAGYTKSTLCK